MKSTPHQTPVSSMKTNSSINLMNLAHSVGSVPTHRPATTSLWDWHHPHLKVGETKVSNVTDISWELSPNSKSTSLAHSLLLLSRVQLSVTPMDCSPPGSSVHGIFQARILEWVPSSYFRGSSCPRDWTHSILHLLLWQADSVWLTSRMLCALCFVLLASRTW